MSSGAPAKMLANKQLHVVCSNGKTYDHMTFHASMAVLNYDRYDTLTPEPIPSLDIHCKVNMSQTISGVNLALCDGEANSCIKGNDMRVLYYKSDASC